MTPTKKQPLFIISGASGVGKSSICVKYCFKGKPNILFWKATFCGTIFITHRRIINWLKENGAANSMTHLDNSCLTPKEGAEAVEKWIVDIQNGG